MILVSNYTNVHSIKLKIQYPQTFIQEFKDSWRHFRKKKLAVAAFVFLGFITFCAVFANLLASNRPLYCTYSGETHFPIFTPNRVDSIFNELTCKQEKFAYSSVDWRTLDLTSVVWPLVPYDPSFLDRYNRPYTAPGDAQEYLAADGEMYPLTGLSRHLLGTTSNGHDVLSALIHGCRTALLIGLLSVGLATFIGIFLGALAGYYGDEKSKAKRAYYYMGFVALFLCYFYGYYARRYNFEEAALEGLFSFLGSFIFSLILCGVMVFICLKVADYLSRFSFFSKVVSIPIDSGVSRVIEILRSIPMILILISFAAVFSGGLWFLILIIGLTVWPGVARLIRAEFLRIISQDYMEAARASGLSERRIIFRHALPNALPPVLVSVSFMIAGAIVAESALSFLGIGLPADEVSWGKLLNYGRGNFHAWWLTIFPGVAIFLTVLSFNLIGERLRDVMSGEE